MFEKKLNIGNHNLYSYNISKYNFKDFLLKLYGLNNFDNIESICKEFNESINNPNYNFNDTDTNLHKKFYNKLKSDNEFKKMYCELIKDIYDFFYKDENLLIYQSYPSIRFQFHDSISVPEHFDADEKASHPLGEKNFLLPITKMQNTNTIHIESIPGSKDYNIFNMEFGEILNFHGNLCSHKNVSNKEGWVRISFDFRVILIKDYYNYVFNKIVYTNPKLSNENTDRIPISLTIGSYYQVTFKNDDIDTMMKWYLPKSRDENMFIMQHRPTFEKEEAEESYKYMLEDNFVTEHKKTKELEDILSEYLDVNNTIMTTSGTTAIILALMSLELNYGDEVIVPNYTMIATVNSIKHLGLKPVIVDINKDTYTLDLNVIKDNITNNTKAVIHVSLNNRYCNLMDIVKFCKDKNIFLIEDAAQSLGCKICDKYLGTYGDIGCYSLSSPKIISSGQGGIIVTNNNILAKKINQIKNFGRKESGKDIFESFGINLKYTDLQAVITIEQMKKLDYRVKRMSEIYNLYYNELNEYIKMIPPLFDGWHPWFIDIICPNNNFRRELVKFLKLHDIQTRETYVEINKSEMYYSDLILPNSNTICNNGLFLPSYVTLTNNQIIHICNLIKTFVVANSEIVTYRNLEINDKNNYLNLIKNFRPINENITTTEFNSIYTNILSHGNIIVAELNDKIIGTITILLEKKFIHNSSIYAHVEDVFIDESYRNKSIGSNLVKKAIDYCKEKNVFKISLNCHENLKDFYEKNKFEKRQINMSQLL